MYMYVNKYSFVVSIIHMYYAYVYVQYESKKCQHKYCSTKGSTFTVLLPKGTF